MLSLQRLEKKERKSKTKPDSKGILKSHGRDSRVKEKKIINLIKHSCHHIWWTPVIAALGRLRWEDHSEFKVRLAYLARFMTLPIG